LLKLLRFLLFPKAFHRVHAQIKPLMKDRLILPAAGSSSCHRDEAPGIYGKTELTA